MQRPRRALALSSAVLLVPALFLVHHRASLRLPASGDSARASQRPAEIVEIQERRSSVATLLELRDVSGPITRAWLRVPRELDPDHQILLTYVGHKTGGKILDLIPERSDVVLMAMQYATTYRHATWRDKLALPRALREGVSETIAGGMLAIGELDARGFDRERVTVLGVSAGSFFAVLHGAHDNAVPRVLVVHGGGNLRRVLTSMYSARGRPWTGRLVGGLAQLFFGPLDSLHHVKRISPRDFTLIAARGDGYFPELSARELYARARAPKAIVWNAGDHVRSKRTDIIDDLVVQIEAYLDGELRVDEREVLRKTLGVASIRKGSIPSSPTTGSTGERPSTGSPTRLGTTAISGPSERRLSESPNTCWLLRPTPP